MTAIRVKAGPGTERKATVRGTGEAGLACHAALAGEIASVRP